MPMFREGTSLFLDSELQKAKQRLVEQEKMLEAYRRRYAGQLPSQLDGNVQAMGNIEAQLHTVSDSMNRARERRLLIERQIADVQGPAVDQQAGVHPESTSRVQQSNSSRQRGGNLPNCGSATPRNIRSSKRRSSRFVSCKPTRTKKRNGRRIRKSHSPPSRWPE